MSEEARQQAADAKQHNTQVLQEADTAWVALAQVNQRVDKLLAAIEAARQS